MMSKERMTNMDKFWLRLDDPTNLMIITAVFEFDQSHDFDRLKEAIEKRWLSFDRFKMKINETSLGYQWVEDENFDIRSHVQRIALAGSGDKNELQEVISNLSTTPLDTAKPLWQMHLIDNYYDGCVILLRVHHCIADGVSLVHAILSITDLDAEGIIPQKAIQPHKVIANLPRPANKISKAIEWMVYQPFNIKKTIDTLSQKKNEIRQNFLQGNTYSDKFNQLSHQLSQMTRSIQKQAFIAPDPKTMFKGKLGIRKNVAWTEPISVSHVKGLGKSLDATINDVLISVMSGVLRNYLIQNNQSVDEINLHVSMPVNRRELGTEYELGNKFALISLALPIHIQDPLLRLQEVKKRNDSIKRSPEAFINYHMLRCVGMGPAKFMKKLINYVANKGTAVLSNVPGPQKHLYLAGNKMKNMMFWVPRTGNIGMGISFISYAGNITVGLACDEKLVNHPQHILDSFKDELELLSSLAQMKKTVEPIKIIPLPVKENRRRNKAKKFGMGHTVKQFMTIRCDTHVEEINKAA